MKKQIYLMLVCLAALYGAYAQTPPSTFSYQAVIRSTDGRLVKNAAVTLVISIRPGQGATPVWQETQNSLTDAFGVVGLELGSGANQVTGPTNFSAIPFGSGGYWVKITRNSAAGPVVTDQKLLSVPYANYALTSGNTFPAGIIVPFAGDTNNVPVGWLLCDGASLNINGSDPKSNLPYNALYAAIGTAWGSAGVGQFNLPDLRGMFLRGVSRSSANDPDAATRTASKPGGNIGNNVGTVQGPELQSHSHNISVDRPGGNREYTVLSYGYGTGNWVSNFGISASTTGGSETRPKNVYVHYIIKL